MTTAAEEHRVIAGRFTELVLGAKAETWDDPSPCPGWAARDVVGHLVGWLPGFLAAGAGVELPEGPSPADDPAGAWGVHSEAVQALLDDPASESVTLRDRNVGELPLPAAITMFYTSDVFLHTWDLARATGQDERLDPERCARMLEGMLPMDAVLRASGHYGPRVEVPADADPQTKLLAFIGRNPAKG